MNQRITLLDEFGNEVEFELIMTFGLDDSDYAALLPVNDIKSEIFLRLEYDDEGNRILVPVDDDEEYHDVKEAYEEFKKERLQ